MKLTIDSQIVEAHQGQTILEAAQENQIYIPHLCKHPDLEAAGGCRLCVVEIEGRDGVFPACETMVEEGLVIHSKTERTQKIRKTSMELMLASHPSECTECPKYGNCELQSLYQYLDASPENWKTKVRNMPEDNRNPLIRHQFVRCIRCGRCVRACRSLREVKVLDYRKSKLDVRIGTEGGLPLADAGCRFCGACVEVCPTGAITDAVNALNPKLSRSKALVPCKNTCPAEIDIPGFLRAIAKEDWEDAAAIIRERVPLPIVLGSICTHPCESECRRGKINEPISICRLKRVAVEMAKKQNSEWKLPGRKAEDTGHKVAIVGSGPSGLTAAYYLAGKGHQVTVFEANEKAGGQLRVGIPEYRLPDSLLDQEIDQILENGIELLVNKKVTQPSELLTQGYDAVLVAIGTHKGTILPMKGNHLAGVLVNTNFLKLARAHQITDIGKKIVVLGGGNVAIDCARTAKRLGAEEVTIVCLEKRDAMTASEEEIAEAEAEGVFIRNAVNFLAIEGEEKVNGVKIQEIRSFCFDENRNLVVDYIEGTECILPAQTVIFAVGQSPEGTLDMGLPLYHGSYIKADACGATEKEGIFAAGDVVTGTKTVIEAVAGGRRCAAEIDRYLGGDGDISEHFRKNSLPDPKLGRIEQFASKKRLETCLPSDIVCEAERCLQCDLRLQLQRNRFWNEYTEEREGDVQ